MENLEKKELHLIPFSELTKLELPQFVVDSISLVEKHDPEKLKIKEMFDLLVAKMPQIDLLKTAYRRHPLTSQLNRLRSLRRLNVSEITFQHRVVTKKNSTIHNPQVELVSIAILRHLSDLNQVKNEESVIRTLNLFFAEVASNEDLQDALETLKFLPLISELKSTHNAVQELISNRRASISQRPKTKTKALRKSILYSLDKLFKEMDVAHCKHPDVDYKPFFAEMNRLLNDYRYVINKRKSVNKSKAEALKANESNQEPNIEATQPMATAMMMNNRNVEAPTEGNGFEEGFDENSEQKKTAASASKLMQLPTDEKKEAK